MNFVFIFTAIVVIINYFNYIIVGPLIYSWNYKERVFTIK